ncbi:MAG: cobalt transporter CbiM [Armatimonadetes bacterium]|nr:cobalt transporter CbiM [Armatimonadota bacterium]
MHIPDGYLSPQTYAPAYGVMIPLWAVASSKLKKTLRSRQVPLLALGAAFSFVIMMFNVPIPCGTTGHAVGAVLIAILLGPWAAMVAVSLALIVQALLFGDGGITAIGANCFNMAVVMPFVGWGVYRLIVGSAPITSRLHQIAGAIGGYIGLNAAALSAGIMFGIQPLLAHDAHGHALYCPFGLKVAIPAMTVEHLLVFGFVEAMVTGLVVAYVQRTDPSLLLAKSNQTPSTRIGRPLPVRIGIGLGVMILLSPLGLYLPAKLGAGSAWGEWSAREIKHIAGYMPRQLEKMGSFWHAPMPDYALRGQKSAPLGTLSMTYILSGLVGVVIIVLAVLALRRMFAGKETDDLTTGVDASSKHA